MEVALPILLLTHKYSDARFILEENICIHITRTLEHDRKATMNIVGYSYWPAGSMAEEDMFSKAINKQWTAIKILSALAQVSELDVYR